MSTKQKKKVGFAGTDNNKQKQNEPAPFKHSHKKTAHALEHAKMVQKGKKFWEEKEQYQPISDVEWWQLKAAKDFEAGIGQTFYHEGTLSLWTDEQVAALQKEMKETLQLAGYEDESINPVRLKTPKHTILPGQKAETTMDDFAAEIQKQQNKNKNKNKSKKKNKKKQQEEESKDPLYDFDDEIIHTGHSDDEDSDGKQSKYNGNSMVQFDIKQLTSMDDLGKFDENKVRSHKRTRTEALRIKLNNMQSELHKVTEISNKQTDIIEENKKKEEDSVQLQVQLSGLTGALQGATDELDRAEEQISEKDKQIANLKRELKISKQMNRELAQTTLDVTNSGLTADDLLKQRIKDANRFAFMLSAMQEQLDFERKQFVKKIHTLELRLEHKDVQLNALYQLYNQLVDQTQTARKSWWERLTTQ